MKGFLTKVKNSPIQLKASISYTVCSILQKCLSLITLPIFTRLLTTEQYGLSTIYASWVAIFTIFVTLNLSYGSFDKAMICFKDDRDGYIASVQGITTILSVVFFAIYFPLRGVFNELLELNTLLVCVMILEMLFGVAYSCWMAKSRFEYKYKPVLVITLSMAVVSAGVALLFVLTTPEKGVARILGFSGVSIAVGLVLYIINFVKGKKFFNKEYWKYALSFNLPLIAYYLSQVIFNQSDRIMISNMCGMDKAAIYGVAYNLAMILTFVVSAINSAYTPWLYKKIEDGKHKDNRNIACYICILLAVLISFVIWLAPEAIWVLAGKEYMEAIWVIPPVAASLLLLFYTNLSVNIEFYFKQKWGLVFASIGAAGLNILLNWWLIPIYGFVVAGYTTLASYVVFAASNYFVIFKRAKKGGELHGIFNIKLLLLIFLVFAAFNAVAVPLYNYWYVRIPVMVVALVLVIVFRKKIISLFKVLKQKTDDEASPEATAEATPATDADSIPNGACAETANVGGDSATGDAIDNDDDAEIVKTDDDTETDAPIVKSEGDENNG